jgi:hypothetical protein
MNIARRKEGAMKLKYFLGLALMAMPAAASAQGMAEPRFPPGFDCAHVAAGSSREGCMRSTLTPRIVPDMNRQRSITGQGMQTPGTIGPPTMPNQPRGETGNMPGSTRSGVNGAVGIGN